MKKVIIFMICALCLCGCTSVETLDSGLQLRNKLQNGNGCSFDVDITADYGDDLYEFTMQCIAEKSGDLRFTVTKPESIAGITGIVYGDTGELTFDDKALAFQSLADGYISPVSSPWVLIHSLRRGYMKSAGEDGAYTRIAIDDSFQEDALHLDVWLNEQNLPLRGDILYKGRRCLVLDVTNFSFL